MTNLVETFAALADRTRLNIVERLLAEGELSAGDLTEGTGISAPAVSRHLKVLREAGVLRRRTDGTRRLYTVSPDSMNAITEWTGSHHAFWQASLDRLDAALTLDEESPA